MSAIQQLLTEHIDIWTAAATEKKSGRGRASISATSVYGINKLRELILELAVRGKLVPQDSSDESASELLKRIQAEKTKLISAGKIKKNQLLNTLTVDEKPFDLPHGWDWARLGFIGNTQTGSTPSKSNPESFGTDIPFVKPGDIYKNYVEYENEGLSFLGAAQSGRVAPSGSVLMVCIGTIGKCNLIERDCSFNQQINSITPYIFDSRYLLSVFRSNYFHTEAWSRSSSTTIAILNKGNWEEICVPIPPLEEQHRIVAKVDELMALCDQLEAQHSEAAYAHEQLVSHLLGTLTQSQSAADFNANWQRIAEYFDILFNTEASIDALKQTLLQLAVMGKLVAQDANDEPASELLKRIVAEKAKLVAEGEIKKDKLITPISKNEKPFELPQNWEWVRVATISKMITSGSRDWAQYLSDEGAKFITMGNLSRGNYELRLDDIRYVNPPKTGEGSRTKLAAHDILCSITGEVGNLGRIPENFGEAYINQHTCLLRFLPLCKNRYFPEALRSPLASKQFNAPQRGIKNSFRLGDLSEMVIPLPPLAEQQRIVVRIDELMELCEQLISCITAANQQQKKLADVLLEHAVTG